MRPILVLLFGILGIGLIIYTVPSLHQRAAARLSYSECDTPMQYRLGSIDPRFGLSAADALSDIKQATDIWSSAEGKDLFIYSQNANLTVNFVYDQRQALDTQITNLNTKLRENSQALQQQIADYNADVRAYEQRLAAFNQTVDTYNREGGAPEQAYKDLLQQQKDLRAQGNALNERARQLNLATNDYNSNVSVLNQDVTQLNNALAQKPEEGIYEYNEGKNTITMYFANNRRELLHTLAHEFGHALGMGHVQDPNAIMYPYTTSLLAVTSDDKNQLSFVCRKQSVLVHWGYVLDTWILTSFQTIRQGIMGGHSRVAP